MLARFLNAKNVQIQTKKILIKDAWECCCAVGHIGDCFCHIGHESKDHQQIISSDKAPMQNNSQGLHPGWSNNPVCVIICYPTCLGKVHSTSHPSTKPRGSRRKLPCRIDQSQTGSVAYDDIYSVVAPPWMQALHVTGEPCCGC